MPDDRDEQMARVRADIIARLRPVCAHWPTELFDELIAKVAALTLKYDIGVGKSPAFNTEATEQLIAELTDIANRTSTTRELKQKE